MERFDSFIFWIENILKIFKLKFFKKLICNLFLEINIYFKPLHV